MTAQLWSQKHLKILNSVSNKLLYFPFLGLFQSLQGLILTGAASGVLMLEEKFQSLQGLILTGFNRLDVERGAGVSIPPRADFNLGQQMIQSKLDVFQSLQGLILTPVH